MPCPGSWRSTLVEHERDGLAHLDDVGGAGGAFGSGSDGAPIRAGKLPASRRLLANLGSHWSVPSSLV